MEVHRKLGRDQTIKFSGTWKFRLNYYAEHKLIDINVFEIENKPSPCAECHFETDKTMVADRNIFYVMST